MPYLGEASEPVDFSYLRVTHIVDGRRMDGKVMMPWEWLTLTRAAK